MEGVLKEILNKKKKSEPPKSVPKKKAPSPPLPTKIVSKTEATDTPKRSFGVQQVLSIVKYAKTSENNVQVESSKKKPPFPYTIQRNVCYEMNTTSEPSKTLCEPVQDIVKRSPTDCIYRISANVACSQNTASLSTIPLAHFTGNIQSLEVTLPTNDFKLKPSSTLYATPIQNSTDEHNHMVYDSTKTPLGKVTPPPEKSLYDPGSTHDATATRQVHPSSKPSNFSHTSPGFSRYELCHSNSKALSPTNQSFLNTSKIPNLYADENYINASCRSVIKEPFGPHTSDIRLGHSPWNQLERQANPFRSTSSRPNVETRNARWRQRCLSDQHVLTQSSPTSHTKHFYPMRGNPNYTLRGGLTTYKKTPYKSLADMATYYSNLEYEDQEDVISLLLSCRSLEKKIEEQHAIIDLLDHDLAEARKALTLPPGWNKINKIEIKKDTDVEAFEALKDLPTTNF